MQLRHIIIPFFVLLLACTVSAGKEKAHTTASDVKHGFTLFKLKGWIVDSESGVDTDIDRLYYPVGTNWKNSDVVFYVRARTKDAKITSVKDLIQETLQEFQSLDSPEFRVEKEEEHVISEDKKAKIVFYTGERWGNREARAYIEEGKIIHSLTLNACNDTVFEKSLPVFYKIVQSYE